MGQILWISAGRHSRLIASILGGLLSLGMIGKPVQPGSRPLMAPSSVSVGRINSVSEPMIRQVVQRRDDNRGNIVFMGIYSGQIDGLQARSFLHEGMAGHPQGWSPLVNVSFVGRKFIGVYRQLAGGFYDLQIRPTYRGRVGQALTIFAVGVGEVYITAGQSNATNSGDPTGFLPDLRVSAFASGSGNGLKQTFPHAGWRWGYDPQPVFDGSDGGSPWPKMASNLAAATGVPIGVYSVGYSATAIADWQPGHTHFDRLTTALNYFKYRGGVRAVLWDQGESDHGLHTDPEVYEARLRRLIAMSRRVTGVPVKWMVAQATGFPERDPLIQSALRQAQAKVVDSVLTFRGPNTDQLGFPYRKLDASNSRPQEDFPHFNAEGVLLLGSFWGISVFNTPGFLDPGVLPVR